MADLKISQLGSIITVVPATDVLPVVQGGTTYKVTPNQLLGAGGTANLASATITGALTVDTTTLVVDATNNRVGIGTASPTGVADFLSAVIGNSNVLTIGNNEYGAATYLNSNSVSLTFNRGPSFKTGAVVSSNVTSGNLSEGYIAFQTSTSNVLTERYRIDNVGNSIWSVAGSTAMTLNSTGLGVGASPTAPLHIFSSATGTGPITNVVGTFRVGAAGRDVSLQFSDTVNQAYVTMLSGALLFGAGGATERVRIDASGRLLVGRTSALSAETFSSLGFALVGGATHQAIIGEASGNVFGGSFTNTPFRIRTNNTEVAQFDASGNFLSYLTSTAPTLSTNGAMVFNLTSNTNLRISVRGTDGTTRTANITLA
jgi:hypothetical protein